MMTPQLKAVVFSTLSNGLISKEILPKLHSFGVNPLCVVTPDYIDDPGFCKEADALITLMDLMSDGQVAAVDKRAKKLKRPVVKLHRHGSDWSEQLEKLMKREMSFQDFLKEEMERENKSVSAVAGMTKATPREVRSWVAGEKLPSRLQMSRLKFILQRMEHHPIYQQVMYRQEDGAAPLQLAAPKAASPDNSAIIAAKASALLTYQSLRDDQSLRSLPHVFIEKMKEVWGMAFTSVEEVDKLVENHVKLKMAPADFITWWEDRKIARAKAAEPPLPPSGEELQAKIDKLTAELKENKDLEGIYEAENARLRGQVVELEGKLKSSFLEQEAIKGRVGPIHVAHINKLEDDLQEAQRQFKESEHAVENLGKALEESEQKRTKTSAERERLQQLLAETQKELEDLRILRRGPGRPSMAATRKWDAETERMRTQLKEAEAATERVYAEHVALIAEKNNEVAHLQEANEELIREGTRAVDALNAHIIELTTKHEAELATARQASGVDEILNSLRALLRVGMLSEDQAAKMLVAELRKKK